MGSEIILGDEFKELKEVKQLSGFSWPFFRTGIQELCVKTEF